MSRKVKLMVLPDKDRELLERFRRRQKTEKRLALRASIILAYSSGMTVMEIVPELHIRHNSVMQ